ncbi:DUF3800 domain-containing protein [Loktanella sp. S4079]|uniref:DUF3800 domain-containing protein n=1 Tax=Loktanella sp. S4079 TaxID=579483 RepID=UPI0005FA4CEF|nr:DUF3800 domain-containing protein [Loktanella sp. S4079]KJZ19590.1 hypothetical protein TW80_01375 [Loktanella sp. S4079]
MATQNSDPEYILFIDEAGDDGLKRVRPIDKKGGTEWLCISGFLIRNANEEKLASQLQAIRTDINATQSDNLHFRKLSPTKKARAAELVAEIPSRAFVVLSNKKNMRGYSNIKAAERHGENSVHWFYNFCVRLLLERATDYCLETSVKEFGTPRIMKVVFSQRGGHRYGQTKAYWELLKLQANAKTTFLKKREIRPEVLRFDQVDYLPHYMHAGLQFADIVASAFYQAVDTLDTRHDPVPAQRLAPIMAREGKRIFDYGIVLQPTPPEKAQLTDCQKEILKFYGCRFQ